VRSALTRAEQERWRATMAAAMRETGLLALATVPLFPPRLEAAIRPGYLALTSPHIIGKGQFEDLSGNVVVGNSIGKNNLDGDTLDAPASPEDMKTTGVLVFSGGTRVTVTIARNI